MNDQNTFEPNHLDVIDPVIVIGALISITISLILFISGLGASSSILFALLGIVISLLLDLIARTTRLETNVLQSIGISRKLMRDSWAMERLIDTIEAWDRVSSSNYHPLLVQIARLRTQDMRDQLVQIAAGEIDVGEPDSRFLSVVVEEAHESVKAVSLVSVDFYGSAPGRKYLEENYNAVQRGVDLTRIFICDEMDSKTEDLMSEMKDNGINILIAYADDIAEELRTAFVISDERLVWTTEFTRDMLFREHHVSAKLEDVMRAADKFDKLLWHAERYTAQS